MALHDPPRPLTASEKLLRYSTEFLVVAIVAIVALRIFGAQTQGRAMADRERRAIDVLRAVHAGEREAMATVGTRFLWLSELVERSPQDSLLRQLKVVTNAKAEGVQLLRARGYYVAVFVRDDERDDGRAWSPEAAQSKSAGVLGYGAFAWPERYQEGTQWAFYVDHRGLLLGSWNHKGMFDGVSPPFPPIANPLRDYNKAYEQKDDSEWFLFDDMLGEIETEATKEASKKSKSGS